MDTDDQKMGGGRLENMKQGVNEEDNDDTPLPGFRFHPTDEELVGFYLRRKIEKKPISIEIIKQIDIYKYDPWDLPKGSNVGDKEWYFFCRRGRKYRNSIRPNRVTGSGFWKATGIDRPIYSEGRSDHCVGLKKSLVYYRGSAGKGTKTDWMMHEFRLPPLDYHPNQKASKIILPSDGIQEAEVWTLCRILKRNTTHKKSVPDWRELPTSKRNNQVSVDTNSKTCSVESDNRQGITISFQNTPIITQQVINEKKPVLFTNNYITDLNNHMVMGPAKSNTQYDEHALSSTVLSAYSNFSSPEILNEFVQYGDWDELRTFVEFAGDQSMI